MTSLLERLLKKGRGVKASVLLAHLKRTTRVGRASRGYLCAGAGVVVVLVAAVSLLTWLEANSDKPSPLKVVDNFLPEAVKQADDQLTTLLGVNKDTGLANTKSG